MANVDILNHPLIPNDSVLNPWQRCIKRAIIAAYQNGIGAPYGLTGAGGSTENIPYQGPNEGSTSILTASSPLATYCCGITLEIFLRAWKEWMKDHWDQSFTNQQAKELRAHFFVYDASYVKGSAGGLLWLADQDPCYEYLEVKDWSDDIRNAPFGTFVQMQFAPHYNSGHSVVMLGAGEFNGKDVIHVFSSNTYYDQTWEYSKGQDPGVGFDFYYIDKVKNGFVRKFHAAEIQDDPA